MNILTDEELEGIKFSQRDQLVDLEVLRAVEAAVLSKLAEQAEEPVGWLCDGELYEVQQYRLFTGDGPIPGQEKLYTETQLLAAQQRTAEACAKVCSMEAWAVDAMDSIRNGDWREYL